MKFYAPIVVIGIVNLLLFFAFIACSMMLLPD